MSKPFTLCCSHSSIMSTCACKILQNSVFLKDTTQVRHIFGESEQPSFYCFETLYNESMCMTQTIEIIPFISLSWDPYSFYVHHVHIDENESKIHFPANTPYIQNNIAIWELMQNLWPLQQLVKKRIIKIPCNCVLVKEV